MIHGFSLNNFKKATPLLGLVVDNKFNKNV